MCERMSLSNVFRIANIWQKIENSKSLDGKFRPKVVFFFRWRDETWTSWCHDFVCTSTWSRLCLSMLRSFVHAVLQLDLQVVFCIDLNPYLWHSTHNSSFTHEFFFSLRHLHTVSYFTTLFFNIRFYDAILFTRLFFTTLLFSTLHCTTLHCTAVL